MKKNSKLYTIFTKMGRSTRILTPHHLHYANIEELSIQLAHALTLNIDYGFPCYMDFDDYLSQIDVSSFDMCYEKMYLLAQHHAYPNGEKGILFEVDHMYTWLYEKFGAEAGYHPEFVKHFGECSNFDQKFMDTTKFLEFVSESYNFNIFKEALSFDFKFEWHSFAEYVTGYLTHWIKKEDFMKEINDLRDVAKKLGATHAYYFMEGPSSVLDLGELDEEDLSWQEIEQHIRKSNDVVRVINIRKCMTNEKYRNAENELIKPHQYRSLIFLDDFKDY